MFKPQTESDLQNNALHSRTGLLGNDPTRNQRENTAIAANHSEGADIQIQRTVWGVYNMLKGCPHVCCELKNLDFTGRSEMCFSVQNMTEVTAWIVRPFPPKNQRAKISVTPKY